MKNKNGFTLVELIAVMTLLLILILIAFPNFSSLESKSKNKYDSATCVIIRGAAKMYVENFTDEVNNNMSSEGYQITVGKLIEKEYLDQDITTSKGVEISKNDYITVKRVESEGNIEYIYECPQVQQN